MNVVGESVEVVRSNDPTKTGLRGEVLLETARTITVECGLRRKVIEKAGTTLMLAGSGKLVAGEELAGRLEDRLGRGLA